MKIDIGIGEQQRADLAQKLSKLLADATPCI